MVIDTGIALLQRLLTLINSSAGPHAVFAGIADSALVMLEADGIAIFEYVEVQNAFSLATARNLSLEAQVQVMQALTRRIPEGGDWLTRLCLTENWGEKLQQQERSVADDMRDMATMITMPLRTSAGKLLGMLAVFYRDPGRAAGQQQVLASLLGGLASVALENALLHRAERHRADFLNDVLRMGDTLQVDQSLDSVLQQTVEIIAETLGWQTVVTVLLDRDSGVMRLAAWHSTDPAMSSYFEHTTRELPWPRHNTWLWRRPEFKISRSYFVDHHKPEAAEVIPGLHANPFLKKNGSPASTISRNQWHHDDFLIVPLTSRGMEIGWIAVDAPRDLRRPSLARIQELEIFADRLAQAIVNTRLYNETEHERLKLVTVLDGITDGVIAFDTQGKLLFCNRAAERLLGMTLPQIPGASMEAMLIDSPLRDFLMEEDGTATKSGELQLPEQKRTLFVNVAPLAYTGRVVLMRDITYFTEMERLRLELLSSLSHDLKSPLTAINVTAALIERAGHLNVRQQEYVERLRGTAQRAVGMVSDLLDLARLEAASRLTQGLCQIPDIVSDVIAEMQFHADEGRVTLISEVPEDLPDIYGDVVRLRQALMNLVGNAIKYTPPGGRVTIGAAATDTEIAVCVQDTGVGIPEEHLPYIFDRFYRVNPETSVEGTGLGLTIARTVIERHGGRIWVNSVKGEGSSFYFTLPRRDHLDNPESPGENS